MIERTLEEEGEAPPTLLSAPYHPVTVLPPTTQPPSGYTPSEVSPHQLAFRRKLSLHTVSADHLLAPRRLLTTEMTEHRGGRGGGSAEWCTRFTGKERYICTNEKKQSLYTSSAIFLHSFLFCLPNLKRFTGKVAAGKLHLCCPSQALPLPLLLFLLQYCVMEAHGLCVPAAYSHRDNESVASVRRGRVVPG
ncbi:unnamed protein product [Pleuronectes platessa]|uniref:Uncharacterized protein n=1 Tax=Pleuronectes platessa TaxID=8262 RepID=A0A9N7YBB7_PLEPL|nr:unnamed protein product [Pleuronectes platessa]